MYKSSNWGLGGKVQYTADIHGAIQRGAIERILFVCDSHLQMNIHIVQFLMHLHREVQMRIWVVIRDLMADQLLFAPQFDVVELGSQHFLFRMGTEYDRVLWKYYII